MKLVRQPERDGSGGAIVTLHVSSKEDIWHLYNIILKGDLVRTKTVRKVKQETATGSQSAEKKVLIMEIEIRGVEFDAGGVIRFSGVNRTETDVVRIGAFHTMTLAYDPPFDITVHKEHWDSITAERIKEACDEDGRADTAAVVLDLGLAHVCLVTGSLCIMKAKIETSIAKKHARMSSGATRDDSIKRFFRMIMEAVVLHVDFTKVKCVLLCSPAMVRDELFDFMMLEAGRAEAPESLKVLLSHKGKFVRVATTNGSIGALKEALVDREVTSRMDTAKCANDVRMWRSFHQQMTDDDTRCCYGPEYVLEAQKHSAVENLFVIDELFRNSEPKVRKYYIALVEDVKNSGGSVHIFSSQHVTGEELKQLGGVAAILRFPMPDLDEIEAKPPEQFMKLHDVEEMIRSYSAGSAGTDSNA